MIQEAQSESGVKTKLEEKGLTHLLVRDELLQRFLRNNLSSEKQKLWDSFVALHLRGLFRDQRYSLYQVHG